MTFVVIHKKPFQRCETCGVPDSTGEFMSIGQSEKYIRLMPHGYQIAAAAYCPSHEEDYR